MPADADREWVDSMPEVYDRLLGPSVFQPFATELARRAAAFGPRHVLELAAGTGIGTNALVEAAPGAEITATDLNKPAAFAEARRVLTPGGRMLFNVWGTVDEHGWARALVAALERAIPHDPPTFIAAVPHGYHDTDVITADLMAGGLRPVSIDTVTLDKHADRAADVATR